MNLDNFGGPAAAEQYYRNLEEPEVCPSCGAYVEYDEACLDPDVGMCWCDMEHHEIVDYVIGKYDIRVDAYPACSPEAFLMGI